MEDNNKTKEQLISELTELRQQIKKLESLSDRYKQIDLSLKREMDFNKSLFQTSPAFVVLINAQGRVVMMNDTMLKALGYTADEVKDSDYLTKFVPERDRLILGEIFKKLIMLRENTINENYVLTRDGREILVEWHGNQIFNSNDEFEFFFGIGIDITDLRRAEAAVRESGIKFKSIYENTYDTIMLLTDSGFFDCNRRTLEMFGFSSKEEFTSVHPSDISPPNQPDGQDSLTAANERIQTAVQQGYCFFEWMHRRKNGEDFPADVILSSYQLGGKKIVQATVRDISERKRIESELHNRTEELRKSEEKYRSIFENAVEGIFQSVPGGGYLSVNPAFAKIFGYDSPQDVLASVTDVAKQLYVNPEDREELVRIIKENGMAEGFEIQLYRKDRSIIWVSVYARKVCDNQGNMLYYEGSFVDITHRKQSELELKKYQEHLEEMVGKRTAELTAALTEARIAREAAEKVNKKITDSLNYAKMIQRSLLANLDVVKTYLPNSFFIWEPRDIVGGDIFFAEKLEDGFIIAVVDCTGHGVPGAFMTMIASSGLRKIIWDEGCHDPAQILKRLSYFVKTTLHQDKTYVVSDDGMDIGIARAVHINIESPAFGFQASELIFAGAKLSLFYVCNGEVTVIAGDRQSIGYKRSDLNFNFSDHKIRIEKGTVFYMASDGFIDQLGADNRRFGSRRFRELLKRIAHLPFEKQREILLEAYETHRGMKQRQDDVTVAGFGF